MGVAAPMVWAARAQQAAPGTRAAVDPPVARVDWVEPVPQRAEQAMLPAEASPAARIQLEAVLLREV